MGDSSADEPASGDASNRERPGSKIAQLVDKYEMADTASELERAWTARGEEHRSLRELTAVFNEQLLERHLGENGQQPLKGETETLYSLLTDDDVNESDRIRARRRLAQQGIDVDRLLDEFVSYQTVRRYLKHHREVTYTPEETNRLEAEAQNLQQLSGRAEAVTESKLETLQSTSDLPLGEFRVAVDIRIYCEECQKQLSVGELLDRGGCDCG